MLSHLRSCHKEFEIMPNRAPPASVVPHSTQVPAIGPREGSDVASCSTSSRCEWHLMHPPDLSNEVLPCFSWTQQAKRNSAGGRAG
jgi:hypothetical protein